MHNVVFLVFRYVFVALSLAYLTSVFVKRKDVQTEVKGRVLEWRLASYKNLHRWLMGFKSVIAAPSQDEERYRNILSFTKFKIGYQGMEYASFFDAPEKLIQFFNEFDSMLHREEGMLDEKLKRNLNDFHYWLDEVILHYGAFVRAEYDQCWHSDEKTIDAHCLLACKVLGIALQEDVNEYFDKIDKLLRDRLQNIKISDIYAQSNEIQTKSIKIFRRSQLNKNTVGLLTVFLLVHNEEKFENNPSLTKNEALLGKMLEEYMNCYCKYLEK